jgi:uncharacterized Zn-binding protein involved in type VI secretion
MPPAVRLSDKAAAPADAHGCPGCPHPVFGPAVNGSANVFVNKKPAIRLKDPGIHMACCGPNQWEVAKGSGSVYVNGKPIARMGDKTKHCGGSGALIMGSPNVFIDDGAAGSMIAKLLKALEDAARDAVMGKLASTKAGKAALWALKAAKALKKAAAKKGAKGKAGKGKAAKGKAAKGKAGKGAKGKGAKGKGAAKNGKKGKPKKNQDLSKNVPDAKETGGIVRVRLVPKAARPESGIPFEITVEKAAKGEITVEVWVRDEAREKGEFVKKTRTTVTASGKAGVLKGSFKAPAYDDKDPSDKGGKDDQYFVFVKASLKGKKPAVSNDVLVTRHGLVFALFEDPVWTKEPRQTRPELVERLTAQLARQRGVEGNVKARILISGKAYPVTFNNDGIAVLHPESRKPKDKDPGAAYEPGEVEVEITAPPALVGKYRVRAFAPIAKKAPK